MSCLKPKQAGDSDVSNRITEYRRSGLPGVNPGSFYISMQENLPLVAFSV